MAIFVDTADKATVLPIILDERMFSDTVIRVTRLSNSVYLACDLRYFNGKFLFHSTPYSKRREKLSELLNVFHSPDLTALIDYDEVPENTPIRGWETYDDVPNTLGVFLPADE